MDTNTPGPDKDDRSPTPKTERDALPRPLVLPTSKGVTFGRLGISIGVVCAAGAVIVSPLAIGWLSLVPSVDWTRLSEIGQTYAFISGLISALALFAVAGSIRVQARQTRIQQLQTVRAMQFDLVKMGFEED